MIKNLRDEKVYLKVVDRINAINDQSARLWEKMTPRQMISHLVDQFALLKGENNFTFKRTFTGIYIYKYLFLYMFKFRKTKVKIGKRYDKQIGGVNALTEMHKEKKILKAELKKYFENPVLSRDVNHPFFGPLSQKQLGVFAFKHMDNHLRQFNS